MLTLATTDLATVAGYVLAAALVGSLVVIAVFCHRQS